MALDAMTLNLAGGFITFASGMFLLVVWAQDRHAWSALWWALGNGLLGVGIILGGLHAALPFLVANVIGPLFMNLSAPCAFIAARVFDRGGIVAYRMAGIVAAWIAAIALCGIVGSERLAACLGAGTAACFYVAAVRTLWLGRAERLRGRMPLIGIVTIHAIALFMLAVQFGLTASYIPIARVGWLGVIQFVGLVYSLGVTVFLVMMLSSRTEQHYRTAALTDPLTGLPNRRAFVDRAQRMLDRHAQSHESAALLAFDLDRFKAINDTFGHAMGDRVLRIFADVLGATLRPTDLAARIGGEEFVAMLPSADDEAALAIANRVRDALQRVAQFVDGQRIGATVSVGIAATAGHQGTIFDILPLADAALYRAKREGRNRVILAHAPTGAAPARSGNVIRIA